MASTPHGEGTSAAPPALNRRLARIAARASVVSRSVLPWVGLGLFALALRSLHAALSPHGYRELAATLARLPGDAIALSLGQTLAG